MANLLTPEFEQYIAQQTINNGTVIFDEFIFANIPTLNEHNLTDYLTLSAVNDHIVHRQAVSKAGVVNQNSVVYSVTLGTEIGDWDYNFIGLINKSKKLLACAIQSEPIKKIKNKAGVQGNSITRSVLLEFSNAKTLTNINVNAQTWQIDFTLRLSGLDEKIRLTNRDMYGRAVFFDDGFLVSRKTGNIYNINAGTAYIEGVRANLPQHTEINATNLPCSIYVDVVHHCTVTGAYETEIQFLTRNKTDYLDQAAHQHYVQIIADIDSQGQITDRRLLDGRFIPNSKKSSATDSESEDTVATSKAVNKAYNRAVEAEGKGLPVGAVLAFPSAVQNPHGFLRCDGSTFGQETYPALYQALGVNTLPDLRRSDVGMTAYFATDNIPEGWIAFDDIEELVSEQAYPELYRYLVAKYGSLSAVPKAKDRFIRNAGALLAVGEVQQDALQDHFHYIPTEAGGDYQAEKDITVVIRDSDTTDVEPGAFKPAQKGRVQANNAAVAGEARAKTYLASTKDRTEKDTRTAEETRPKSLVLKLCIKAQNTLDGVQFWIKAFGNVSNAGELEVSRLAQDMQQVRLEKADISHTHTASDITDFDTGVDNRIAQLFTYQKIGNFEVRKYPDGAMIQTCRDRQASRRTSNNQLFSLTLPVAFIRSPVVSATIEENVVLNTARDDTYISLKQASRTKIQYGILDDGSLYQTIDCVHIIAIGRWK
ncbi:phage tail protein [Avibacterium paragallinarum]|uniref:phage tail-collar fiber domain-containing protein n=2 Tax=Avibacterium paragallinarum TaxID=728 RepID=UPI0039872ABB